MQIQWATCPLDSFIPGKSKRTESQERRPAMKFLLVALNAKYIHSNPALYSLRAYAGELQQHVEIAEYTINNPFSDVLADIYKRKPDAVGFSCYIWNIELVLSLTRELKKLLPEVPVWLGGPEVSYDAPELLTEHPEIDGIMVGEGEETFRELLSYYLVERDGKDGGASVRADGVRVKKALSDIPGLCLRSGYTVTRELTELDKLPFLYEDLGKFENRIIYYESSRGCPFRCSYCLSSIDKKVRLRDLTTVKKELQFFLDRKVPQVKFIDRTFNCNHEHATSIWRYILEQDNGVTNFHFEISADLLNEEELELLGKMRPGLAQLEIGVQSTNPETLAAIHRSMDVDKLEQIVARIRSGQNVHQHLDLIAGLPYEDYDSFGASFDRVYAMKPEQLQLGFLKVLKGSEMADRAEEFGIFYMDRAPYEVLFTKWLSFAEVQKLKRIEEMVELYYNSNQFRHTLRFLERAFSSAFRMYEALAEYYEEQGYVVNSPARSYRYQVLLDFACRWDGANEVIYRELLTHDMYLRENLKSRPAFGKDLQGYKETIRGIYRREEAERRFLPEYRDYDSKQLEKMTHLEPYHYPVWELPLTGKVQALDMPVFLLYDYKERCPLTGEARMVQVECL